MVRQELKLPLVSIITPSFNQAAYIAETIKSVRDQPYPHIEHIIIDGGSTDGTVQLLQHYSHEDHRLRYVSEPDRGQAHAINKGLKMATGDIIGWLNSDDTYSLGAISKAVEALREHPEWALVYGNAYYMNEHSELINFYPVEPYSKEMLSRVNTICQPAAFFRRTAVESLGGVDEQLYFCMDYDLWIRMDQQFSIGHIDVFLANARIHPACKNVRDWLDIGLPEVFEISQKYYGETSHYWIMEFIVNHIDRGGSWMMQQLKNYRISGPSPTVVEMNRYEDLWVPPHFRCVIHIDPSNPLQKIMMKGRHRLSEFFPGCGPLTISVLINGKTIMEQGSKEGEFYLEIPVHTDKNECVLEIHTDSWFIPSNYSDSIDNRVLSFMLDDIFPLSSRESDYYILLQRLG